MFAGVVDGVFGDFHHQIFIGHLGLAAQARIGFEAPSLVEQIFFELAGLFEAVETLAHNHVAGGAGAGFFAGVFDFDVVVEQQIANALAGGGVFNHFAFRFVRSAFTSRGRTLAEIIQNAGRTSNKKARSAIQMTEIKGKRLPRDLDARQWVALWKAVR
mgnify:CR=1 FL=1